MGKIAFDFFKKEVFYKIEVSWYVFALVLFVPSRNKFQVFKFKMFGKKPYILNWAKKPVPIYAEIR